MNENVCHSKQKWNHDKCRYECVKLDDWGSCKNVYIWNPSTCDCNKACKLGNEILNLTETSTDDRIGTTEKGDCLIHSILLVIMCLILVVIFCSCEKRLIGNLLLECEDEMWNATETSTNDKKGVCKKINCLIHTIFLVIICSILVVIFIICYYYYTRDWTQKAHVVLN